MTQTPILTSKGKPRFVNKKDGKGLIDTEMDPKTLRAQEVEHGKKAGNRPKVTSLDKGVREEKAALNEAKGVIHGQVK